MSTNSNLLTVGKVEATIIRKSIKNLHLCVLPPIGQVRVTAPMSMTDDVIRTLIAMKIHWIKKHQIKFVAQRRESVRKYISGESHYFFGKRYRLEVLSEKKPVRVELRGKTKMILHVRLRSSIAKRERVVREWHRKELRTVVEKMIKKWEKKIGVSAQNWGIKRMKTRWGTCDHNAQRIWLNLELAKKPMSTVEYVVVHELVHLIERTHNDHFVRLMDKHLPKWRTEKDDLNRFILAHETWCK